MRHFRSILYALVLAPAVWVLVAVGLTHDLTARGRDGFAVESLTGLVLLLLGGAAYGILVFAPISPLGPVVAGVVFLVVGVWAIEWPSGYAGTWPSGVVKDGFDLSRPGYGLAALLAVPLILTVLSVRRWSGFEPVVLPIIGPVGRARGAAAVAGTPVAVLQTAVLPVSQPGAFRANGEGERTALIRTPGADVAPEATTVLTRPAEDDGEETTVLRAPAAVDESATEDVATGNEEPTDAIPDEQPTRDVLDEPPTEAVPTEAVPTEAVPGENDEPTDAIADEQATEDVVGSAAGEPTVSLGDDEATEPSRAVGPAGDEASADDEPVTSLLVLTEDQQPAGEEVTDDDEAAHVELAAGDESAAAGEEQSVVDERAADSGPVVDEEPTTSVLTSAHSEAVAPDEEIGEEVVVVEETTYLLVPADDDARTQALQLAAELENDGERTQVIRPVGYEPGQTTRDLGTPGDRTQVIWPSAHRVPGETTQVIRLPDPADDGTRTQVIRSGHVTPPSEHLQPRPVTPPGDADRTLAMPRVETAHPGDRDEPTLVTPPPNGVEPVRLPHQRVDSDPLPAEPEEPTEPDAPPSIARTESPNFAEDPTGRIVSPVLPPDEPTRTMTVMNIERPPDEAPEIPTQRQPSADG